MYHYIEREWKSKSRDVTIFKLYSSFINLTIFKKCFLLSYNTSQLYPLSPCPYSHRPPPSPESLLLYFLLKISDVPVITAEHDSITICNKTRPASSLGWIRLPSHGKEFLRIGRRVKTPLLSLLEIQQKPQTKQPQRECREANTDRASSMVTSSISVRPCEPCIFDSVGLVLPVFLTPLSPTTLSLILCKVLKALPTVWLWLSLWWELKLSSGAGGNLWNDYGLDIDPMSIAEYLTID